MNHLKSFLSVFRFQYQVLVDQTKQPNGIAMHQFELVLVIKRKLSVLHQVFQWPFIKVNGVRNSCKKFVKTEVLPVTLLFFAEAIRPDQSGGEEHRRCDGVSQD